MIKPFARFLSAPLLCAAFAAAAVSVASGAPFKDFIIFGDSLSDTGNIADRTDDDLGLRYPSPDFGYTDGRFTNGKDTDPASRKRKGVWHEQLAVNYFGLPRTTASLDGGSDYAFGGGKTTAGASKRSVFEDPVFGNEIEITIDDMGKQVDDYLAKHSPAPDSLFVLWGGANDILDSQDDATTTNAAANVHGYLVRLAQAGAKSFLVINVPPIGMVPNYSGRGNSAALNQACADYAAKLSASVDAAKAELAAQSPSVVVIVYKLDVYNLFLRYLTNPAAFGFIDVTNLAQDKDVNPDKYLFWDGLHPTTRGHALIAAEAFTTLTGTPVVSINTVDSAFAENYGQAKYYLTRTGLDLSSRLPVPITLSGTAIAGVDYNQRKSSKAIKPGKFMAGITITAFGDGSKEGDEDVTLSVGADGGYQLGFPTSATSTITDGN